MKQKGGSVSHEKLKLHEFVFAALMQDIGKVLHRAELQKSTSSKEFLEENPCKLVTDDTWQRIISLSTAHESEENIKGVDKNYALMLKAARQVAAGENHDFQTGSKNKITPLYSIFQEIRINSAQEIEYMKAIPFKVIGSENMMPIDAKQVIKIADYKKLCESFKSGYNSLSKEWLDPRDFPSFLKSVDYLLYKHFHCIPSDTQEINSTSSFYHYTRTVAMVAAALYQNYNDFESDLNIEEIKDTKGYLLIGGDLSGIQNYLYDLNPENSKFSAKLLRARSFKIKSLSDMLIFKIINQCELCQHNILINAGGKFIILAPNTETINSELNRIQQEVEEVFYREFLGAVSLNMDWSIEIKFNELQPENFKETLGIFFNRLETKKLTRFKTRLTKNENKKWDPRAFVVNDDKIVNDSMCKICNRRLKHKNENECFSCKQEIELGQALPNKQYVIITKIENVHNELIRLGDISLYLIEENKLDEMKNAFLKDSLPYDIYAYKSGKSNRYHQYPFKATAAYTHISKDRSVTDFEIISNMARQNWGDGISGLQANAIIKGDVDNLGAVFQKGLISKDGKLSLSRYMSVSSMIDFFFAEHIPWLLENGSAKFYGVNIPFNPIYTVYTGGDDFCLVGPWINVLLFAQKLRNDFKEFTCDNPELHFSCGIELLHGKSPVKFYIEKAESALDIAKDAHSFIHKKTNKDSVFVFDTLIPWDEYDAFLKEAESYFTWLRSKENRGLTTQLAYRLFEYRKAYMNTKYPKEDQKINVRDLLYPAQITYDLKRNVNNELPVYHSIQKLIQVDNNSKIDHFRILNAVLHAAIYANRIS
ncbi:MAG: type III-A CRISPR-associated protein Cas10/Csm1 [Candidatus Cloacimonadales bacterium]|jgi:CRISPR-associated protein Csm1|nr:type III-A CRISPR-associated protein Cas10/Csm1 [Candidatus Cloacimonadales bacterium]